MTILPEFRLASIRSCASETRSNVVTVSMIGTNVFETNLSIDDLANDSTNSFLYYKKEKKVFIITTVTVVVLLKETHSYEKLDH